MVVCISVLYEVEVLSVFDSKASDNFRSMPEEEQVKLTLKELVDVATSEREVNDNKVNN